MKVTKIEKGTLAEHFETWKSKINESAEDTKLEVEAPIVCEQALKEIEDRKKKIEKDLEVVTKATEKCVNEEQKMIEDSKKLTEAYLNENFKDAWAINEGLCTIKCKGRKELRQIISECKAKGIRYKFEKTLDEDYKYDFSCKAKEIIPSKEEIENSANNEPMDTNNLPTNTEDKPQLRELSSEPSTQDDLEEGKDAKLDVAITKVFESKVTDKIKARRQKKFETVEPKEVEPKEDENPLQEDLKLLGKLEDFEPSDKARGLWQEIVDAGLVRDLDKILNDLYPSGTTIQDFDDLLAYSPDFIRKMLDLEEKEIAQEQEEPITMDADSITDVEDNAKEEKEFKEVDLSSDDNTSFMDDLLKDDRITTEVAKEVDEKDKNKYLTDETGYSEKDLGDDDTSDLDSLLDKDLENEE